jgi:hypothetical protein
MTTAAFEPTNVLIDRTFPEFGNHAAAASAEKNQVRSHADVSPFE